MKLNHLFLPEFQVIRDLDIYFTPWLPSTPRPLEPTYGLDFLVGVNGTGKSTVLKRLYDLMKKIEDNNSPVDYGFTLEYNLGTDGNSRTIRISNQEESDGTTDDISSGQTSKIFINGEEVPWNPEEILPKMIIAFTTGDESEWLRLDEPQKPERINPNIRQSLPLEELAIRELPGHLTDLSEEEQGSTSEISRLLFIRSSQLSLVTLCGLLTDLAKENVDQRALAPVFREAKLIGDHEELESAIAGFSLKFRMANGLTTPEERQQVQRLAQYATRCLQLGTDHLLVFDFSRQENTTARAIVEEFVTGLELFKILAKLDRPIANRQKLLREINIFLQRSTRQHPETDSQDDPPLLLLDSLSDGERSFLGRLCLFSLLGDTEALILLDEPEVHFNDYWKRKIVYLLDRSLRNQYSHVLITSHSSITLSDVPQEDVIVLARNGSYTDSSFYSPIKTLAANPGDILVHVFEAPDASGEYGIQYITEVLARLSNSPLEQRREGIEQLLEHIGPGYWNYKVRRELLEVEHLIERATR